MPPETIIITGTPAVGKTAIAKKLAAKLDAKYVNLTKLAIQEDLILEKDKQRNTLVINEREMKKKIRNLIETSENGTIIFDGHYAASVVPRNLVTLAFVIRRNPIELRDVLKKRKYPKIKIEENLASEILDVCLVEALNLLDGKRVCEINVTGKSLNASLKEISSVIKDISRCQVGLVDWIGQLESKGLLDEFLKL